MKAIVLVSYGSPEGLQFREIKKPTPGKNEVLVKIYATSAHIGDTRIRRVDPFLVRIIFGLFQPRKNLVLGLELAGVIDEVGESVENFKVGDEVFALNSFRLGAYAEYKCLPAKLQSGLFKKRGLVVHKPTNLSFEEAATVPAGCLTALKNLQKAKIKKGDKLLINGASGSLGTYAIQLANFFGAKITAVCSAKNFDLVKSIGANYTIDYTKEDFTALDQKFDIVYDAVMKSKASKCKRILKKNGSFINNTGAGKIQTHDLLFIKDLIEKGNLKPIIDRIYPWEEIQEAHSYVDKGHKVGNVAITVYKSEKANI